MMRGLFILLVLHSMWLRRAIEGNSIGKSEDADFSASGNLLILVTLWVGNTLAGTTTVNSQHVINLFAVVNAAGPRAEICNAFQLSIQSQNSGRHLPKVIRRKNLERKRARPCADDVFIHASRGLYRVLCICYYQGNFLYTHMCVCVWSIASLSRVSN